MKLHSAIRIETVLRFLQDHHEHATGCGILSPLLFMIMINFVLKKTVDECSRDISWKGQTRLRELEIRNVMKTCILSV